MSRTREEISVILWSGNGAGAIYEPESWVVVDGHKAVAWQLLQ